MFDDLIKVLRMDESAQVRQDCGEQRVSSREARLAATNILYSVSQVQGTTSKILNV